jgi:hypothetical protein
MAEAKLDSNEEYEQLAEEFYRKTGLMAPGKDVPAAMGLQDKAETWQKWNLFLKDKTIAGLKASNARLIKAIEPLMDEIPLFVGVMDLADDAEVQLTVTVGELRNLIAAKESEEGK